MDVKFELESKHDFVKKTRNIKREIKKEVFLYHRIIKKIQSFWECIISQVGPFMKMGRIQLEVSERYAFCMFGTQSELSYEERPTFMQKLKMTNTKCL